MNAVGETPTLLDMNELDDFIGDLERIQSALGDATAFFATYEAGYLEMARQVGRQTLLAMRPPEMDSDAWAENVANFTDLVFSRTLAGGLEILYAGRTGLREEEAAGLVSYTAITYDDVWEWVNAGQENGGKDMTDAELVRGRDPKQIAYDVITAINQHHLGFEKKDYGRITARLEEWVNSRVLAGDMDLLLEAVLEAWYNALCPVVERDFEKWVDEVVG